MLDVEYLLDPSTFAGPVIYLYRTGVLNASMRNTLTAMAAEEGRWRIPCSPASLLSGMWTLSLTETASLTLCDWSDHDGPKAPDEQLEAMIETVLACMDLRLALFVKSGSGLTKHAAWSRLVAASRVIEEPKINQDTLLPVLRYLEATTDLADKPKLIEQDGFVARFQHMFEDEGFDLHALMQTFDEVVVTSTDPRTGRYDHRDHRRAASNRRKHPSPSTYLRKFITDPTGWNAVDLVARLDELRWRRGWTAHASLAALFDTTSHVLTRFSNTDSSETLRKEAVLATVWGAMLLAAEDRLVPDAAREISGSSQLLDNLTVELDRLARNFIGKCDRNYRSDPLASIWSGLQKPHKLHVEPNLNKVMTTARENLITALVQAVERILEHKDTPWLRRLEECLTTKEPAKKADEHDAAANEPATFDDIVGHCRVVDALRTRVRAREYGTPLLLYGPDGVGKRTLARLYAKAVLCDRLPSVGISCNRCQTCREFDQGGGFGYGYINAKGEKAKDLALTLVAIANQTSFSPNVVLLIDNIDGCQPAVIDVLLKTLEKPPSGVVFVLMGRDLRGIRLAGQSRCLVYRMRPLCMDEAQVLAQSFLKAEEGPRDERVATLLAATARGLPGELQTQAHRVAGLSVPMLPTIRAELQLDWVETIRTYWLAALGGTLSHTSPWLSIDAEKDSIWISRTRTFLHHLRFNSLNSACTDSISIDPAFMYRDHAEMDQINILIRHYAKRFHVSPDTIWRMLAEFWLSNRHVKDGQLRPAWNTLRRRLADRAGASQY